MKKNIKIPIILAFSATLCLVPLLSDSSLMPGQYGYARTRASDSDMWEDETDLDIWDDETDFDIRDDETETGEESSPDQTEIYGKDSYTSSRSELGSGAADRPAAAQGTGKTRKISKRSGEQEAMGNFLVSGDTDICCYDDIHEALYIFKSDGSLTIENASTGETANRIVIKSGVKAEIELKGVSISSGSSPIELQEEDDHVQDETQLELIITGDCKLNSVSGPAISVIYGTRLDISGDGSLMASTQAEGCAAIGAGLANGWPGDIYISGGNIIATGAEGGAGIGGGRTSDAVEEESFIIDISGGNIFATGGAGAAGIGGGEGNTADHAQISISGGTVTATAGFGADAIGVGSGGTPSDGSFTTGSDGNAIIWLLDGGLFGCESLDAIKNEFGSEINAIIFVEGGGSLANAGRVFGTVELSEDLSIAGSEELMIPAGAKLVIASGKELIVYGEATNRGSIENLGIIDIAETSAYKLQNYGSIDNSKGLIGTDDEGELKIKNHGDGKLFPRRVGDIELSVINDQGSAYTEADRDAGRSFRLRAVIRLKNEDAKYVPGQGSLEFILKNKDTGESLSFSGSYDGGYKVQSELLDPAELPEGGYSLFAELSGDESFKAFRSTETDTLIEGSKQETDTGEGGDQDGGGQDGSQGSDSGNGSHSFGSSHGGATHAESVYREDEQGAHGYDWEAGLAADTSYISGYVSSQSGQGGNWIRNGRGWWFRWTDGSWPFDSWQRLWWNDDLYWYHFGAEGYLDSGWYTDRDGSIYYLHPLHDGSFGYMYEGRHVIDGQEYSFTTALEAPLQGRPEGSLRY